MRFIFLEGILSGLGEAFSNARVLQSWSFLEYNLTNTSAIRCWDRTPSERCLIGVNVSETRVVSKFALIGV